MEKIQEELKSLPEGDNSKVHLYEKMADIAVDMGNYKHAITYYTKTVTELLSCLKCNSIITLMCLNIGTPKNH